MARPLVSIVIPTYNRAQDLERALKSVLAQTYSEWEALVVDNHSIDKTDDLVKSFNDERMKLLKIHNDGVIAASRNLAIAHARGEYIAFLDSDDWWMPEKLQESVGRLEDGADVVYHDLFYVTKHDQRWFFKHTRSRPLIAPAYEDLVINGNVLGTSSVVVRKTILDRIGGLSEDRDVVTWEDYDAWIRMAKVTERLHFIDKRMGYCWTGGGNTLRPIRVLENIEAFERRYSRGAAGNIDCVWTPYANGRWRYVLGDYKSAISYFRQVLVKPVSAGTKLRAIVLIAMSAIYMLFGIGPKGAVSDGHAK